MAKLKYLHFTFLVIIAIFYSLFQINSEPHDLIRTRFDNLIIVLSSIWAVVALILTIFKRTSKNQKESIVIYYRHLLNNKYYLSISNIILTILTIFLFFQLLIYRQYGFYTDKDVSIYLYDKTSEVNFVGFIHANEIKKFRLHIGKRKIVFKDILKNEAIHATTINVKPIWKNIKLNIYTVSLKEGKKYEKTF